MGKKIDPVKDYIDIKDLYSMFSASLEKVTTLGKAKPGYKTMIEFDLREEVQKIKLELNKITKVANMHCLQNSL